LRFTLKNLAAVGSVLGLALAIHGARQDDAAFANRFAATRGVMNAERADAAAVLL